jgi:hypothetical protein
MVDPGDFFHINNYESGVFSELLTENTEHLITGNINKVLFKNQMKSSITERIINVRESRKLTKIVDDIIYFADELHDLRANIVYIKDSFDWEYSEIIAGCLYKIADYYG